MAGNLLGRRGWYQYTADNGNLYCYQTDRDLATAVGATLNDDEQPLPRGFKPRGVYAEDANGNRKFIICPTTETAAYAAEGSTSLTIDNSTFNTTGKRGERARIPFNRPDPTP